MHEEKAANSGSERRFSRLTVATAIALSAIGYFIAGYIGISLAVPPGYATIIWPASGVALCALLARGPRLWPGVWLGSFSFNLMTGFDSLAGLENPARIVAIAAALGAGASIQALTGLAMARRFADGIELANMRRIGFAALLVIALPCLIAPTIGVTSLFLSGAIGFELLLHNWLTWYAGDFFGVLLIMPILLLSNRSPVAVRWHGRSLQGISSLVAMSLIGTLLLTFYAWQFITEREYKQAEDGFAAMAADTEEALRYRLQIYQRGLQSGAAFASLHGTVTPSEWRNYVERIGIARSYPGMRGMGMFRAVSDSELPAYREQFTRVFGDRFRIHPEVDCDEHFVIDRIEPLADNVAALGLDLAFEEGRREAIALSTTTDEPVLTRPIVLVQDDRHGAGFLLMVPVLGEADEPTGQWVYAPLVAGELLDSLTPRQGEDFALEVYHGAGAQPDVLLYAAGEIGAAPQFEQLQTVNLAGQPFSLRWTSLRPFETRYTSSAPQVALVSGFTITILLGSLLAIFLRRESHVVREVNDATAELAERNRMLEMAEATAHIGHWHLDLATDRIQWSDEVYRLHGTQPGNSPALEKAIEFYHPDDRGMVEQSIETAAETCEPYRFKARLLIRDGELRHVEVRGLVETNAAGEATDILGVIIDRTDETIMREQLTTMIEEARAADKAKSSFLANMSHEIRTPMNGVIGFTELALVDETNPEQKRRLQMIADSGNAMLRLLNDLLDFAKIEANQMAIVSEPTDLRHTLRSCQRLMEPVAKAQDIALDLEIDPALPAGVLLDKMRVRQIVLNLLGNALKFTEEGQVSISATISRQSDKTDRILITVRDTGIGIAADRLDSIFGKFIQADDTTARRYGGTGLGLPISAELAELMGGNLRAESKPGKGSAFTLSLPLEASSGAPTSATAAQGIEQCEPETRLNILVAEDNPVNQELIMAMVNKAGHDCSLARDGSQAVDCVMEARRGGHPFDMVLMDMQMPNMDGLQAARAIRDAGIHAEELPILAVTANAYPDDIQKCVIAGMQAHLSKPLRLNALSAAIGQWAGRVETESMPPNAEAPTASFGERFEEETDPRLRMMFDDRKQAAINAIDAVMQRGELAAEKKQDIADLLHQIAGVAAYFGQEELGETCRAMQDEILETIDAARALEILTEVRERLLRP